MSLSLHHALMLFEYGAIFYLLVLGAIYFILTLVGFVEMVRRRFTRRDAEDAPTLLAPVSVLAPACNEETTIRERVRALLSLSYPQFEVIVIDDGSKDATLKLLIEEFHLYRSARYYENTLPAKPVRAVYESLDPIPLIVVDKESGGKADALNVGINLARYPLVCAVNPDSLLESNALLRAARPFLEDPKRVLAVGGIVGAANGCATAAGPILRVHLPRSWIARFQVVESIRSFLAERVAFSAFNCLLVGSGTFGLFSKAAVLAVGGYRTSTIDADMELIVRLHHWARRRNKHYRIVFQPEPVCWARVSESLQAVKLQRNLVTRGAIETFRLHRSILGRPSFGLLGLFAFPYLLLSEGLSPAVELTGWFLAVAGICLHLFSWQVPAAFLLAAVIYPTTLRVGSLMLGELSTNRCPRVPALLLLVAAAILENLGFRQLLTLWRAQVFWHMLRGKNLRDKHV